MKLTRHITKLVIRILAAAALLVLSVFLTGALIIKVMFTPEHLNAVLTDQLQQIFQRPVHMESATIVVFKGIRIKGLRVLDAPDFPARDFISSGVFTARYKFFPLLGAKLVLTDMKLMSPVIQFVKRQDGSWNVSDIVHNYRLSMKRLNLGMDSAQISNGTLTYVDLQRNVQHTLYGVNIGFSRFSFKNDFPLNISFLSRNKVRGNIVEGGFRMKGMINLAKLEWHDAFARELDMSLTVSGKSMRVSGEIHNFINPEVLAVVDLPDINSRDMFPLLNFPEGMSIPKSRWTLDAVFPEQGRIVLRSAGGKAGTLLWRANGKFDFSGSTPTYSLWVQGGPFGLSEVSRWWKNAAPCALKGKARFNVIIECTERGTVVPKAFAVLYKAGGDIKGFRFSDVDLVLSSNDSFKKFSFKVSNGVVTGNGQKISGIRINSRLSGDTLEIKRMSAEWDGSPFKFRATISSIFSGARKAEITAFIKRLDIAKAESLINAVSAAVKKDGSSPRKIYSSGPRRLKWLRDFRNALPDDIPVSSGWISVDRVVHPTFSSNNLKIAWSLKGFSADMRRLSGRIGLSAGPGLFYGIQGLAERKIFYKVVFAPFLVMYKMDRMGVFKIGSRFKDLNFSKIGGDYDFESGRMRINNFYIDGTAVSACSDGSIDWADEKMDMTIYTIFKEGSSLGGLSENLTDASGRPALAFTLEGPMERPSRKMLSPKKNGKIIEEAINRGIRADFSGLNRFIRESSINQSKDARVPH